MKQGGLQRSINSLKDYFSKRDDILMAFIFGSQVRGKTTLESDFDIAVYFKPKSGRLEYEDDVFYDQETEIWNDLEKLLRSKVDFVVLNRLPSVSAFPIINKGIPIIIKDRKIYLDFLLRVSSLAIDFREFMRDFVAIKARSHSLSIEDKDNLIKIVNFLEKELMDSEEYEKLDFRTYKSDAKKRRSVERWVENIVNASIDIAKILLASKKQQLPDTYVDTVNLLSILEEFDEEISKKMASFVKLRNLMAHEYLDLRFSQIQEFIKEAKKIYGYLIEYADNFIKKN
ncbi:MAG: HepT-like ribonuclease domain-containing protein [Patescibacteria group bacterium]